MAIRQKRKETKKCPRCGEKLISTANICPNCKLKFERLENLSNTIAKKELKLGNTQNVIMTTDRPKDINLKVFLPLMITLGWCGAHNLYVGKKKLGLFALISACVNLPVMLVSELLILYGQYVYFINNILYSITTFFMAMVFLIWGYDLIMFILKRFKYPASIDKSKIVMDTNIAYARKELIKDIEDLRAEKKAKTKDVK